MKEELPSVYDALAALEDATSCTDDLAGIAETQLEREKELASRRIRAAENAKREAEQDRAAFEEALADRMQAADLSTERLASEAEALNVTARSVASSVLGEIATVSAAWQEFIR
eukprot:4190267-Prymnesium_polylepis.2